MWAITIEAHGPGRAVWRYSDAEVGLAQLASPRDDLGEGRRASLMDDTLGRQRRGRPARLLDDLRGRSAVLLFFLATSRGTRRRTHRVGRVFTAPSKLAQAIRPSAVGMRPRC